MTQYIKLPSGVVEVEEFLDYCGIPYEEKDLEGKRIPLMLRFRFYLEAVELEGLITAESTEEQHQAALKSCLEKAFRDVGGPRVIGAEPAPTAWSSCLSTSACASCKSGCNE